MNIFRSILSFRYVKSQNKNECDYIQIYGCVCNEISIYQAKQLKIYLGKLLNGKKPKKIKFRKHSFCPGLYVSAYFTDGGFGVLLDDADLSKSEVKRIYKWLNKYV